MRIEVLFMAVVFALAGTLQQKEDVLLSIDVQYQEGQHISNAKVENKSGELLKGNFVFTMKKTGSSTSSSRQSGDFVLKAAEEKILSRSSINLNEGDTAYCKLVVKIEDKTYTAEKILPED